MQPRGALRAGLSPRGVTSIERRGSEVVRPGDTLEATIVLANDGSAAAHDGVLHLRVDPRLDEMTVTEGTARLRWIGPSQARRTPIPSISERSTRIRPGG